MTLPFLRRAAPMALASLVLAPRALHAQEEPPATPSVPSDFPRLVLDTGRPKVSAPEPDLVRFQIHGEYQIRYEHLRSFPLDPTLSLVNAHPGAVGDSLGQSDFASHWLRVTPRLQIREHIQIVAQMDVLTGLAIGDLAHDTYADQTPRDSYNAFSNVQPRWLYLDFRTKGGLFRVGQQPSHWGMGIIANNGDHPSLFGDYRYGAISERILFATKPLGADNGFTIAVAGDLVFRDNTAILTRDDHAFQGVFAAFYERGENLLGLYGVYRHQTHDRSPGDSFPYADTIDAGVIDASGRFAAPVAGEDAFVFGAFEAATILGSTNSERTNAMALANSSTAIHSYGGAVQLGAVHRAACACASSDRTDNTFGDVVGQVEIGYASGDANPGDDVEHRFVFDPNHKVGLLLFDEVMRFQTARAAVALRDPLLGNANRPPPGVDLLPTNGGVSGAQYVNPTVIVRPRRWLDLKGGVVVAQATADVVDPYRYGTQGSYVNYRGGDPRRRDLGVEADLGAEARIPLDYNMIFSLGAQGGVLFPGGAFADAQGNGMKAPWIVVGRAGLLF